VYEAAYATAQMLLEAVQLNVQKQQGHFKEVRGCYTIHVRDPGQPFSGDNLVGTEEDHVNDGCTRACATTLIVPCSGHMGRFRVRKEALQAQRAAMQQHPDQRRHQRSSSAKQSEQESDEYDSEDDLPSERYSVLSLAGEHFHPSISNSPPAVDLSEDDAIHVRADPAEETQPSHQRVYPSDSNTSSDSDLPDDMKAEERNRRRVEHQERMFTQLNLGGKKSSR
jgi:hypothetical protein